jgi:hypothetical protein
MFNSTVISRKNSTIIIPPGIKPVWIADVTSTGSLKMKFYRAVFVPNFKISQTNVS